MIVYALNASDIYLWASLNVRFLDDTRPSYHHPPSVFVDAALLVKRLLAMYEKSKGFFFYAIIQPERLVFVTTPKDDMQMPAPTAAPVTPLPPPPPSSHPNSVLTALSSAVPGAVYYSPYANTKSPAQTGRKVRTECVLTMGTIADAPLDDSKPKYPIVGSSDAYRLQPPSASYSVHLNKPELFFEVPLSMSFCNSIVWPSKKSCSVQQWHVIDVRG